MPLLDPSLPAFPLLGGPAALSQGTVHQQAVIDEATGLCYATQIMNGGQMIGGETVAPTFEQRAARGDLAVNQLSPTGELLAVMYVRGFDHGGALGIQHDQADGKTYLWTGCDAVEAALGANGYASKICRFPFTAGSVLDVDSPEVDVYDAAPAGSHLTPSVDEVHDQLAIRYLSGSTYRVTVWPLAAYAAGTGPAPVYGPLLLPPESEFQSWVLFGEYLYTWRGYSDSPLSFTRYSLETGSQIDVIPNSQHPDLVYREAEAIFIHKPSSPNPVVAWGVATDMVNRRKLSLFAPETAGDATLTATATPDGIAVEAEIGAADTITRWSIDRNPDTYLVASGSGADAPGGEVQVLDALMPHCVPVTYVLTVEWASGEVKEFVSPEVQFTPPGGCGTAASVGDAPTTLGCPTGYVARIHWRGGGRPLPLRLTETLVSATWSRTLSDTSTAEAAFARDGDCCDGLLDIHPWVHELTIYREFPGRQPELVWQGPVTRTRLTPTELIVEASDVFAWLEKLVNTFRVQYTTASADQYGRKRGRVTEIARTILKTALIDSTISSPKDYPGIYEHLKLKSDGLPVISWRRDGTTTADDGTVTVRTKIWAAYIADIFRELEKSGLRWTTIGRTLYLRSQSTETSLPTARLSIGDFSGGTEIIRDGGETATRVFASSQSGDDLKGKALGWGDTVTAYGRLDLLVKSEEDSPSDAQLLRIAKQGRAGRYPTPLVISMPSSSTLSASAGITVRQLVPGERIDVVGDDCLHISQGFLLTDVEGSWNQGSGESISVGLTTLPATAVEG